MAGFDIDLSLIYKGVTYREAAAGMQAFRRDLDRAADRINPMLRMELLRHLQSTAQLVAQRNSGPWPGGTTSRSISRRSGDAMESLQRGVRITGVGGNLQGEMHGVFYLMIHEYGGTMRATRAQFMTIPLPAALNNDGTPKKRTAREWNNTFVGQSKAGNLIVFQRQGRQVIPLYVLKKEVRIKPRLGLRRAQEDAMDTFVRRVAADVRREVMG